MPSHIDSLPSLDCKHFMEMFEEVAQSLGKKEENKDAVSAAGLLENLSVDENKSKDVSSGEETAAATKDEKKESESEETKPDAEKKDGESSSAAWI